MIKKVIIIDDSITALNLLKNKFASCGWEAYGTLSAKDGYDMIFDVAPDIIVTDAIMPFIGGFQFVKMTRENDKISKIPIIIYSVLPQANAKYYLKESCIEYFLSKNDNIDELIELAENLIEKHPLDEDYKIDILKSKIPTHDFSQKENILNETEEQLKIDTNELEKKLKEKYNFSLSDETIFSGFFEILYDVLRYELCVVYPHLSCKQEKDIFFDIRDIILSPIFQETISKKYDAKEIVLFKKYAPNLKMITNEEEFYSKIEFNFEYKDRPIASMVFYSRQRGKWSDEDDLEKVKNLVYDFFKAYFINKNNTNAKKSSLSEKYFDGKFNISTKRELSHENIYTAVISISNYSEIISFLSKEDIDILNSKISEKIMNCLENDEQVVKNDEDEYLIVLYIKEYKNLIERLNFIINSVEQIKYDDFSIEVLIGASNCIIDGNYNIFEAQKNAYLALERSSKTEKAVIYNATE